MPGCTIVDSVYCGQVGRAPSTISRELQRNGGSQGYRVYIQARGALKKELLKHLRRSRVMRRSRHHTLKTEDRTNTRDAVSISERPTTAEDRAIPGHWEGDLLFGNATSQIATLVERHSRFVMLVKVPNKNSEAVVNALIRHASKLPRELYKSLTWDRGSEMADHNRFTVATDIKVYFCDPQHPWQRGSNENTNGLLRQYFPKGTDLSVYSQARLDVLARRLNERPKKTLNFDTPAERFHQTLHRPVESATDFGHNLPLAASVTLPFERRLGSRKRPLAWLHPFRDPSCAGARGNHQT